MGTRSKTNILDKNGNVIISIYRQNDGYFQGMGKDIQEFLSTSELAKSINKHNYYPGYNGGVEDLAGKFFLFICTKTREVMPASNEGNIDFAYEYEIRWEKGSGLLARGRENGGQRSQEWFSLYANGKVSLTNLPEQT